MVDMYDKYVQNAHKNRLVKCVIFQNPEHLHPPDSDSSFTLSMYYNNTSKWKASEESSDSVEIFP